MDEKKNDIELTRLDQILSERACSEPHIGKNAFQVRNIERG